MMRKAAGAISLIAGLSSLFAFGCRHELRLNPFTGKFEVEKRSPPIDPAVLRERDAFVQRMRSAKVSVRVMSARFPDPRRRDVIELAVAVDGIPDELTAYRISVTGFNGGRIYGDPRSEIGGIVYELQRTRDGWTARNIGNGRVSSTNGKTLAMQVALIWVSAPATEVPREVEFQVLCRSNDGAAEVVLFYGSVPLPG
jgi:hypothetical protein